MGEGPSHCDLPIDRDVTGTSISSSSHLPYRRHAQTDKMGLHDKDDKDDETSEPPETEPNWLVEILPDSPDHPHNWSTKKKIFHTISYGQTTFTAQFSASIISPAIEQISQEFHVGREVGMLCFSIYVLGNMVGPVLFAPISEVYGRKLGVFIPCFISGILILVIANVQSIAAIVVFRFVAGIFAAAPIVSSGGAMTDLWKPNQRAAAMVLYAINIVTGSTTSPVLGALLVGTGPYGWRWVCWLSGLIQTIIPIVNMIFLSETYVPVLEQRAAKKMRLQTGRWELHSKHDEWALDVSEFLHIHFRRPIRMLFTPIISVLVVYSGYVYGTLFLMISSVDFLFREVHHFGSVNAELPLFSIFVGFLFGGLANTLSSRRYASIAHRTGKRPAPEERLYAMMWLGWLMPAGCFIYAWTMYKSIHWIVPCVGLLCAGSGLSVSFQAILVYISDYTGRYAASGIAANTFVRSIFGGVFPLFSIQMYECLGPHWGSSLLGFLSSLAVPLPFIIYVYGPRIRRGDPFNQVNQ